MARVNEGSDIIFKAKRDIADYLLEKIDQNAQQKIGTEVEFFFLKPDRSPITLIDGQKIFASFREYFQAAGNEVTTHTEMHGGLPSITSLAINNLGNIDLETGHGFEFASRVCSNPYDVCDVNRIFMTSLPQIENESGYDTIFQGYLPEYAQRVPVRRNRSHALRDSYKERFGAAAAEILQVQSATASTQVTVDACRDDFHEVFRTFLLLEPALQLHHADQSGRAYRRRQAYGRTVPQQVSPLSDIWNATDNKSAILPLINRLMKINVPFLPQKDGTYLKLPISSVTRQPPTVRDMMMAGKLSEMNLNNILPLFQTHPAMRKPGLLEIRSPDSKGSPEVIGEIAARVAGTAYHPRRRKQLLSEFRYFTAMDIEKFHYLAASQSKKAALECRVAGQPIKAHLEKILDICYAPPRESFALPTLPTLAAG